MQGMAPPLLPFERGDHRRPCGSSVLKKAVQGAAPHSRTPVRRGSIAALRSSVVTAGAIVARVERSSARPADNLFASHDAASLAPWLEVRGETASAARATVAKVLRHVHRAAGDVAWSDAALSALGINRNARRELLELDPRPSLTIASRAPSGDGATRLLLAAQDGALVEAVLIPGPGRTTLCVSSQVGCARACSFCETGTLGLGRHLPEDIAVRRAARVPPACG